MQGRCGAPTGEWLELGSHGGTIGLIEELCALAVAIIVDLRHCLDLENVGRLSRPLFKCPRALEEMRLRPGLLTAWFPLCFPPIASGRRFEGACRESKDYSSLGQAWNLPRHAQNLPDLGVS